MLSLGLSLSIQQPASKFSRSGAALLFDDYYNRVIADGGIVEAQNCFIKALFYLGVRNTYDYTETIFPRWIADGATVEAESCFNKSFFSINV